MSHHDDALRDLLDSERARPALSAEHRARMLARVTAAIGGGPGGPGGLAGAGGGVGRSTAPHAASSPFGRLASRAAWSTAGRALGLVATFALGGVTGAAVHARLAHRAASSPRALHAARAPAAPPVAPVVAAPLVPAPAPAVAAALPSRAALAPPAADLTIPPSEVIDAAPPASAPAPRAHSDGTLAAARARLAVAYDALARGDGPGALDALARYQREFPRGRLAEERDGLWVQALVAAGRYDEARARAARFHREHAASIFAAAVDAVVRSIP